MSLLGGRFRLERELGSGGMARVFLGTDEVLGRPVAVKVLKAGFDDSEMAERFRREGRTSARLSHPNVVQVYDAGEGELDGREVSYIVMEYVPGGDLKELMDERGSLSEGELSRIGADVAAGLAHAHERGVVHRDVKPHNILLDGSRHAKLTDFGIARALDVTQVTQTGFYLGTALYSSPEQLQGHPVTPKSDVYSLGATLYQAATGEPPFTGGPLTVASQHAGKDPTPPREVGAPVSEGLEATILGCLAKDPADRPDAREIRERLEEAGQDAATDDGTRAPAAAPPSSPTAGTRRGRPVPSGAPASTRAMPGRNRRGRRALAMLAVLALVATLALVGTVLALALPGESGSGESASGGPDRQQARSGNGDDRGRPDAAGQPAPQTVPQRTVPEQTAPQRTIPEQTTLRETVPERTTPEPTRPEPENGLTADAAAQTVEQVYESAAAGDYGTSYGLLSSSFQQGTSQAGWSDQFATLEGITFVEGPAATVSGDTATVTGTTIARHTDRTEQNTGTWTLVNEGGEWRLDDLSVSGEEI